MHCAYAQICRLEKGKGGEVTATIEGVEVKTYVEGSQERVLLG